jgi:cell division protein FtsL
MTPPAAAASTAHRARVAAPLRPRVAPPQPRRVSGPARAPARRPPAPSVGAPEVQSRSERGLVLGLLEAVASLTSHGAIDRLIRGRIWIAVIAFALIGIVTLQLLVLQLNANIGRALVREAQLQRENTALSIEGSELAGGERVEAKAVRLGMQLVPVGALRFLTSYPPADIARAAAALSTPVHTTSAGASAAIGTGTSAGGSEGGAASDASASTAASGDSGAAGATGASGEQAPAGEASAPSSTQAAAGTSSEAPATAEAGAPASAPAAAAGGTEPMGAGTEPTGAG